VSFVNDKIGGGHRFNLSDYLYLIEVLGKRIHHTWAYIELNIQCRDTGQQRGIELSLLRFEIRVNNEHVVFDFFVQPPMSAPFSTISRIIPLHFFVLGL